MHNYTIKKNEILRKKKDIELLFDINNKLVSESITVHYCVSKDHFIYKPKVQVFFLVTKRNIIKAVDRNKIRRRMKEAYRLNKNLLNTVFLSANEKIKLGFVYSLSYIEKYSKIESNIKFSLSNLTNLVCTFSNDAKKDYNKS